MLNDLVTRLGKKWSAIQAKLNRSADSCRDKYREMSEEFVKGRWKEVETENLKRLIREHLHVDASMPMPQLGQFVERENIQIPWSSISKRMGKRSRLSCFKKWQKMTGIFVGSEGVKRDIIEQSLGSLSGPSHGKASEWIPENEARDPKRLKTDNGSEGVKPAGNISTHSAASAGAAAAMAAAAVAATQDGDYEVYSAKMAAETVEAVELPDTDALRETI